MHRITKIAVRAPEGTVQPEGFPMKGVETLFSTSPADHEIMVFVHQDQVGLHQKMKKVVKEAVETWFGNGAKLRFHFLDPPGCIH